MGPGLGAVEPGAGGGPGLGGRRRAGGGGRPGPRRPVGRRGCRCWWSPPRRSPGSAARSCRHLLLRPARRSLLIVLAWRARPGQLARGRRRWWPSDCWPASASRSSSPSPSWRSSPWPDPSGGPEAAVVTLLAGAAPWRSGSCRWRSTSRAGSVPGPGPPGPRRPARHGSPRCSTTRPAGPLTSGRSPATPSWRSARWPSCRWLRASRCLVLAPRHRRRPSPSGDPSGRPSCRWQPTCGSLPPMDPSLVPSAGRPSSWPPSSRPCHRRPGPVRQGRLPAGLSAGRRHRPAAPARRALAAIRPAARRPHRIVAVLDGVVSVGCGRRRRPRRADRFLSATGVLPAQCGQERVRLVASRPATRPLSRHPGDHPRGRCHRRRPGRPLARLVDRPRHASSSTPSTEGQNFYRNAGWALPDTRMALIVPGAVIYNELHGALYYASGDSAAWRPGGLGAPDAPPPCPVWPRWPPKAGNTSAHPAVRSGATWSGRVPPGPPFSGSRSSGRRSGALGTGL